MNTRYLRFFYFAIWGLLDGYKKILFFYETDKKKFLLSEDAFGYDSRFEIYYQYINSILNSTPDKNKIFNDFSLLFYVFLESMGISLYKQTQSSCLNDNNSVIPVLNNFIETPARNAREFIKNLINNDPVILKRHLFFQSMHFDTLSVCKLIETDKFRESAKQYFTDPLSYFREISKINMKDTTHKMTVAQEISCLLQHLITLPSENEGVELCRCAIALRYCSPN